MRYRSQNWLNNRTRGSNWNASASYVTGSHSMKFGYQGNYWRDDREMHVNNQSLGYIGVSLPGVPFFPISINAVHQPVQRERARDAGVVLRAGQWTMNRLTLQGALRYDHPWSWFPEQVEPASTVLPRRHLRARPTA